jgi:exonuclease 3'-5' domain-containing protein 1
MSAPPKDLCVEVIDTQLSLHSMLDRIANLPTNPPSLFCDVEGMNLGRHGSISMLSIYAVPTNTAYLVDVQLLGGSDAFTSTNDERKVSLKVLLESSAIPKVFSDAHKCSDALFGFHQISLGGVKDVQLMELGCRPGPLSAKRYVACQIRCLADCSVSSDVQKALQRSKPDMARLFYKNQKREAGDIPNKRLLKMGAAQQHRFQHLILLPELHRLYETKLSRPSERFWQVQVQQATADRIKLSQQAPSHESVQDNNTRTLGPWSESDIQQAVEAWNGDVLFDAMRGDEGDDDGNDSLLQDMANGECDDDDEDDYYQDTAKDCDGWEEDNMRNGE